MERAEGREVISHGREIIPPDSFISITYIRVAPEQMQGFLQKSRSIYMEAGVVTPGLIYKRFHIDVDEFYTVTVWQSREDMVRFRDSENHSDAVRNVSQYGTTTRFASFIGNAIPDWNQVKKILAKEGRNPGA